MRSEGGESIRISKRLFASVVVGAALIISTVMVVSLIGGDDKPEVATEKPPADEQPPQDDQDDTPAEEPAGTDDTSPNTDDASDKDEDALPDADEGSDDLPDEGDDAPDKGDGKGAKSGQCHRHMVANAGLDQQICEKNAEDHAPVGGSDCEDDESEEDGLRAGECGCGDGGKGKCQSGA